MKSNEAHQELKALRGDSRRRRPDPCSNPKTSLNEIIQHIARLKKSHRRDATVMESVATIECYLSSIAKAFDNDKEGTPRVEQMHWAVAASAVDDAVFLGAAYAAMLAKLTLAPGKKSQNWKYIRKVHKAHPRWRIKDIYAEAGKRCLKDGQSWTLKLSTVEKHLAEMT